MSKQPKRWSNATVEPAKKMSNKEKKAARAKKKAQRIKERKAKKNNQSPESSK